MDKNNNNKKVFILPLRPRSEERENRLEQIRLETTRSLLGNPNISVQEMREMNKVKPGNTIEVTFLKNTTK